MIDRNRTGSLSHVFGPAHATVRHALPGKAAWRWRAPQLGVVVALLTLTTMTVEAVSLGHITVGRQANGSVVTSTRQVITPVGRQVAFRGRPNAVAVSPDGTTAAFLTAYYKAIMVVDLAAGTVKQEFAPGDNSASFDGIVYARDGRRLYASLASGKILIATVGTTGTLSLGALVSLPQPTGNPYPGGLALSADGKTLYVALSRDNALGVFDLSTQKLVAEIPVGNAPHSVALAGGKAYVTDEGGRRAVPGDFTNDSGGAAIVANRGSGGATTGTVSVVDLAARTTTRTIAVGLHPTALYVHNQDLFVANTNSDTISVIDTTRDQVVKTITVQPFPHAPFGSSPNALAMLPGQRLVVSLGRNNALAVYDWQGASMPVRFAGLVPTGWYPGGLATDRRGNRLVVANVKGVGSLGPPQAVGPSPDTRRVGPYVHSYLGSASLIPYPTTRELARDTTRVVRNNGWDRLGDESNLRADNTGGDVPARAIPLRIGDPSTIKHVFYIIKENRTYDQILGDIGRGNSDPSLTVFGLDVTPNHHALATEFPLLDNLYASGSNSADGHQWTDQAMAPDYLEKAFGSFVRSYPFNGGDSLAYLPTGFLWQDALRQGRTVRNYGEYANQFTGPQGQYGTWSDWYHDALILDGQEQGQLHAPLGTFQTRSDVPSNDRLLDRNFPPFDTGIPDQYRYQIFLRDFNRYVENGTLPSLSLMELPADHTSGTAPGYPSPRAQVADNDLALGKIVDTISHSPYWRDSAIFVVEDDAQNGVDHVDGHRTVGFVISPYARRGIVDSTYYTQIDIVRTIEQILGLPPMNQMDLAATPMRDAFTNTPDDRPFDALPNTVPLDELNPDPNATPSPTAVATVSATIPATVTPTVTPTVAASATIPATVTPTVTPTVAASATATTPAATTTMPTSTSMVSATGPTTATPTADGSTAQAAWASASAAMFHGARFIPDGPDERLLNRAIWYSVKGYTTPYPGDKAVLTPQEVLDQDHYLWQVRPDFSAGHGARP